MSIRHRCRGAAATFVRASAVRAGAEIDQIIAD